MSRDGQRARFFSTAPSSADQLLSIYGYYAACMRKFVERVVTRQVFTFAGSGEWLFGGIRIPARVPGMAIVMRNDRSWIRCCGCFAARITLLGSRGKT